MINISMHGYGEIELIDEEFDVWQEDLSSYHTESQADWDDEEQSFYFECLHRWHDRSYNYI
jgi:hypothetical protein